MHGCIFFYFCTQSIALPELCISSLTSSKISIINTYVRMFTNDYCIWYELCATNSYSG